MQGQERKGWDARVEMHQEGAYGAGMQGYDCTGRNALVGMGKQEMERRECTGGMHGKECKGWNGKVGMGGCRNAMVGMQWPGCNGKNSRVEMDR